MAVSLGQCIQTIERAVPPVYALDGDPIGLHVGDKKAPVEKIMLALEATRSVLDQCVQKGAQLLVVHHPLIFSPLKRLTGGNVVERLVRRLVQENIALYAMHTNMDMHPQGMGLEWGKRLGLQDLRPLAPKPQAGCCKLVTFVPEKQLDAVREALAQAGAGQIGEYDTCSFSHPGVGSFRGSDLTNPFVGQKGRLESEPEIRLEMVVPKPLVGRAVRALYEAHPYEEPAYDLIELNEFKCLEQLIWTGRFEKKLRWAEFIEKVANATPGFSGARANAPGSRTRIQTVALSTGSGSSCLPVVKGLGVDAYLTGELGYHLFWEAAEDGLPCVAVGHYESEQFFARTLQRILKSYGLDVPLVIAHERPPAKITT